MNQQRFVFNNKQLKLNIVEWRCRNPQSMTESCLLLHGFSNNAYIWQEIAQALSQYYDVYALDFRGHGDSDWDAEGDYTHEQFVLDAKYTIESLNLDHLHIIGHSLGARIASLYLLESRKPILSLTLIDSGPEVNSNGSKKIKDDIINSPKTFSSPHHYVDHLSNIYWLADQRTLQTMSQHDLRPDEGYWRLKLDPKVTDSLWKNKTLTQEKLWYAFNNIQAPCLILRGQLSAILSKDTALKMSRQISQATLKNIQKAGHAVMTDNPKETIKQLLNFLQENSESL